MSPSTCTRLWCFWDTTWHLQVGRWKEVRRGNCECVAKRIHALSVLLGVLQRSCDSFEEADQRRWDASCTDRDSGTSVLESPRYLVLSRPWISHHPWGLPHGTPRRRSRAGCRRKSGVVGGENAAASLRGLRPRTVARLARAREGSRSVQRCFRALPPPVHTFSQPDLDQPSLPVGSRMHPLRRGRGHPRSADTPAGWHSPASPDRTLWPLHDGLHAGARLGATASAFPGQGRAATSGCAGR